ncbi:MAG: BON domain-containing protein [Burkholderiaceae bacterium]|nr:BON domain-containing protein [Burkholderiaceae bacterium]
MAKLIISALIACGLLAQTGCAVTSGQSSMGQYVDDSTITARVKKRFAEDPTVAATRISVETMNGTVQLSGFATTESERARAAQIARSVPDVRDVRNDVIVRPAAQ